MNVLYFDRFNIFLLALESDTIPKEGETVALSDKDGETVEYHVEKVVHNIIMDSHKGVDHRVRVYLR